MLHRLWDNNFARILATALLYNSSLLCTENKFTTISKRPFRNMMRVCIFHLMIILEEKQ